MCIRDRFNPLQAWLDMKAQLPELAIEGIGITYVYPVSYTHLGTCAEPNSRSAMHTALDEAICGSASTSMAQKRHNRRYSTRANMGRSAVIGRGRM